MKTRRILALVLALLMTVSVCACTKKEEVPEEYLGKYISVQAEMLGITLGRMK